MGSCRSDCGSDARVIERPDGKQEFLGRAYRWQGRYFECGRDRLHRIVYQHVHGPIPAGRGWHVHHIDGNRTNNQPENLELLPAHEHMSHHNTDIDAELLRARLRALDENRGKAAAWHCSPEGRRWHSLHARGEKERRRESDCEVCGRRFRHVQFDARFCGRACKAKARRDSGIDNETRKCSECGTEFQANRYSGVRTCSRSCGGRRARRNR